MAINLLNTSTVVAKNLNVLVYGQAGAGKTSLIPTLPTPVVISSEGGLLSIAGSAIPYVEVVCLGTEKKSNKDPRAAYGEMQTTMAEVIRSFRDLPRHVLMTAKLEKSQDEMGRMLYAPSMPGNKTGQALPYFFDLNGRDYTLASGDSLRTRYFPLSEYPKIWKALKA